VAGSLNVFLKIWAERAECFLKISAKLKIIQFMPKPLKYYDIRVKPPALHIVKVRGIG
jgi:hypothetical protein